MTPLEFIAWLDGYTTEKSTVSTGEIRRKLLDIQIYPQFTVSVPQTIPCGTLSDSPGTATSGYIVPV